MIGLVLALIAGFFFCGSNIVIRKATYRSGESISSWAISIFLGVVFFGLLITIFKELEQLLYLSWLGFGSLAAAGIVHFVIGRMLAYSSLRLIGVNRYLPITRCSLIFAALLGIIFLGEPVTTSLVLALILIVGGVILTSTTAPSTTASPDIKSGFSARGLLAAWGAALCWGFSPALIKIGLSEVDSPLVAAFVSYAAASIVAGGLLFKSKSKVKLHQVERKSLALSLGGATFLSLAQTLRYTALDYSPVSVVAPITSASDLFLALPLSYLINREIEVFNPKIIVGTISAMLGVILMFWAA